MGATVYTTAGGRRFHFDRECPPLAAGREIQALRAGVGALSGLYRLRTRSNLGAALLGYTACRVCVPPALALPPTGETYGHEPVTGTGLFATDPPVCRRCTVRGLRWTTGGRNPRPVPVDWPCTSAAVLGLVVVDADCWNARYPVGTPVAAYPGARCDEPLHTTTRTPAWSLGHGTSVVSVDGYAGGIALTHVDPL